MQNYDVLIKEKIDKMGDTPRERYNNLVEMLSHKKYIIRDREAGNEIPDVYETYLEAREKLDIYIEQDIANGIYVPDFYEIVEIWQ